MRRAHGPRLHGLRPRKTLIKNPTLPNTHWLGGGLRLNRPLQVFQGGREINIAHSGSLGVRRLLPDHVRRINGPEWQTSDRLSRCVCAQHLPDGSDERLHGPPPIARPVGPGGVTRQRRVDRCQNLISAARDRASVKTAQPVQMQRESDCTCVSNFSEQASKAFLVGC